MAVYLYAVDTFNILVIILHNLIDHFYSTRLFGYSIIIAYWCTIDVREHSDMTYSWTSPLIDTL